MTDPRIDAFAPRVGLSTITTYARRDLPIALLAAGTTWFAMLSWRGFSDVWGAYLGPLLLLAVVVALTGVLLRVAPRRRRLGLAIQVLLVSVVVWLMLGGSLLHPVSSSHHLAHTVHEAWFSASTFEPPIPGAAPSIAPLMIPCGALALLTIDVLACWARRVAWAGLALVVVYGVPIGLPGG